ncbi:YdbL family protein [Rhodovibrionaceae bacterium A322]
MTAQLFTRRRFLAFGLTVSAGLVLASSLSAPAFAQSADNLRSSGQAGERFDGYMEARDGSAKAAVAKINQQRKAVYEKRAKQQGVSVDQVGKVYAEQIFNKLPKGAWFKQANGQWIQK